jgi:hypothetical protein
MRRPFSKGINLKSTRIDVPKMTALVGVQMEYSILFGQMFSTDYVQTNVSESFPLKIKSQTYHCMRQLQSAGIERPDDPQRLANHDVLGVFPADLCFEPVHHPCLVQALHAFGHRALEDDVEGILVVARRQDLGLAFARVPEAPGLLVEDSFAPRLAATGIRGGGQMPAARPICQKKRKCTSAIRTSYHTRDMPVNCRRRCLIASGSDKHSTNVPLRWALAASSSPPRNTM